MSIFSRHNLPALLTMIGIALVALVAVGAGIYTVTQTGTATGCTVVEKDRTRNEDGTSDARIYTEQCGTFVVEDTVLDWRFNSADVYGGIEEGKTYDFGYRGVRAPLFSMFPNITEVSNERAN